MQNGNPSTRSRIGLNAVNFFLAELAGVIGPFLAVYLKQRNWEYGSIGIAASAAGLGTLIAQTPAGYICDRIHNRKLLLGVTSVILGLCFVFLPAAASNVALVTILLFISGFASAFFVPLLATLALSLVGNKRFPAIMGENQGWNHAGNIAAALIALMVVRLLGVESIFFVTAIVSLFAMTSLTLIQSRELHPDIDGKIPESHGLHLLAEVGDFFQHRQTKILLICVTLFHLANAPVLPLVGLYIKQLGGADENVALTVLIAQAVMIPVALLAAKYCENLGRKPVFTFAMIILPIRILLYTITTQPKLLLAIQTLDGIGAGIYGVAIALICHDLMKGKTGFNLLLGLSQTALALGGFIGTLGQGFVTQYLGFRATFFVLAAIAIFGAALFLLAFQETKDKTAVL